MALGEAERPKVGKASVRYAGCVSTPPALSPVTATTKFPPGPEPLSETVSVEVSEPEMEVGLSEAVTPEGEPRMFTLKLTVPLKPLPELS